MKFGKVLLTGLLVPALVTPAIAAEAVRPTAKPVIAAATLDRSLVVRSSKRAGAKIDGENNVFLAALGPLLLAGVVVTVAAVAAVAVAAVADKKSSPD